MVPKCSLSTPWVDNDFAPCFRQTIVDGLIPLAILAWSMVAIVIAWRRHWQSSSMAYTPLKGSFPVVGYGAVGANGADQDVVDDSSSSESTVAPDYVKRPSRWSVYSWAKLLAIFQLVIYTYAIVCVQSHQFKLDDGAEDPSSFYLMISYGAQTIFWACAVILATINIVISATPIALSDTICRQLTMLYGVGLAVGLLDLRTYYLAHDISNVGIGYTISICATCISFVLLIFAINEERHAPNEPVISETGRIMSGEHWASLYSKFMFCWVYPMMKMGYSRTLNDDDLMEMPPENRAKIALSYYRNHKKNSMFLSLLKTFKAPLLIQVAYSIVWSVVMFGPPYFLNKIIKFIESSDKHDTEPVFTAFLYVLGLFVTNSMQSLAQQQALYIGRTLGIRLQSIVVGEVFSKSLRRRDESGSGQADSESSDKKKSNVNNLLSVDAQKIGEITAYIFFLYSYPLQIAISIWALYRLLGHAALWGVLIMVLSQPFTYWVSSRFEHLHQAVMSATDARLKLVNELLGAIRIVKFFAWEKEFRKRIFATREVELKAIRARLMTFLWMGSTWILIPTIIMITVFYVYTTYADMTASTAFTALALFNSFRGALDEFPMIISIVLQARVSMGRVEKFLQEDEVMLPPPRPEVRNVEIGFVDNASFSWEKPSDESSQRKTSLRNLNLNFPRNKLSIVCGPTGSGKTTLLASLLGETYPVQGGAILPRQLPSRSRGLGGAVSGVAYVAQTAWLQNCSIKDNILFGLPEDKERYENVLYMTALTRDLDILEFGDSTEVGEKGITLSGGQKQRVAIARAVYSQADIVILDDCLSAVDAHTAKHLYQHCLQGKLMRGRTVILVTHHVGLCIKGASYIVALKDGEVAGAGDPVQVRKSGVLGDELSQAEEEHINSQEEKAVDGPIPTVPKAAKSPQKDGAGKLTQEEARADGSVSWDVYATYFFASGGYTFWFAVLVLFALAQGVVLGQDYWIKVWSSAYKSSGQHDDGDATLFGVFSIGQLGPVSEAGSLAMSYIRPLDVKNTIGTRQSVDVAYYLGVYFLIGVLSLIVTSLRSYILYCGTLNASRRIHAQLLDKILRAKVRFFDTTPVGRIVNRFSSDLETIDQSVGPQFSFFLYSIVATLCVIALVTVVTPAFIIPGIVITVVFWKIGMYYLATSRDMKRLNSVSRSPIYVQFNESVNGVATIRAFGCQKRFIEENFKKLDGNNRPFIWMWATNRWLHCRVDVMGAFVGFCAGFVLILGRSWVDPGLAGLSLSYALMFTHHVLWVVRFYAMNEMNGNAIERVHEYLDVEQEPPAHVPEHVLRPTWPETGAVQIKDLVMQYSPESPPVLRDISFNVRPREKVGIVGRTGSGKSTLALSLFRFMEATSGQIMIDDVDISKIGLEDLRSRLTIIPQDPVLFSGTLRSNLDPFDQHDDAELWASLKRAHLVSSDRPETASYQAQDGAHANNVVSLDAVVTENGSNWSQGQRQLIALARALVKKSSLIILDEATSSVDFDTDHKIQQTIRTEFVESALLCIAHRIRTVADYDRILVLDQGKVIEYDTPYTLMMREGGVFRQMCERSGEFAELLSIAKAAHSDT